MSGAMTFLAGQFKVYAVADHELVLKITPKHRFQKATDFGLGEAHMFANTPAIRDLIPGYYGGCYLTGNLETEFAGGPGTLREDAIAALMVCDRIPMTAERLWAGHAWLHFPAAPATAAAASAASALAAEKPAPGQQNTMARKDGEARKLHPKTP